MNHEITPTYFLTHQVVGNSCKKMHDKSRLGIKGRVDMVGTVHDNLLTQ
jgi:hypothetical protein